MFICPIKYLIMGMDDKYGFYESKRDNNGFNKVFDFKLEGDYTFGFGLTYR